MEKRVRSVVEIAEEILRSEGRQEVFGCKCKHGIPEVESSCSAGIAKVLTLLEAGNFETALDAVEEVLRYNKACLDAWICKGSALGGLERYDEAEECFDRVLDREPNDIGALRGKAGACRYQGRYKEAIEYSDIVLERFLDDVATWIIKGDALAALGKQEEAEKAYNRAHLFSDEGYGIKLITLEEFMSSEQDDEFKLFSLDEFLKAGNAGMFDS